MGIVLFYYELSRFLEDKTYEEIAGNLLNEVISEIINIKDNSFKNGLSSIGWGIKQILLNKCELLVV